LTKILNFLRFFFTNHLDADTDTLSPNLASTVDYGVMIGGFYASNSLAAKQRPTQRPWGRASCFSRYERHATGGHSTTPQHQLLSGTRVYGRVDTSLTMILIYFAHKSALYFSVSDLFYDVFSCSACTKSNGKMIMNLKGCGQETAMA
jgi:hypothetical protein